MKPFNGPVVRQAIPASHPEARQVPPESSSAATTPSRPDAAATLPSARGAESRMATRVEPRVEQRAESRFERQQLVLPSLAISPACTDHPASEPRAEPRSEPRAEPRAEPRVEPRVEPRTEPEHERRQELKRELNREQNRDPVHVPRQDAKSASRTEQRPDPRPEFNPEYRREQKQEPTPQPKPMPSADHRPELLSDPKALPQPGERPAASYQPEPALSQRPADLRQSMSALPPPASSPPPAPSEIQPDWIFRSGPIQLQIPVPSPQDLPGEAGRLLPWFSPVPLAWLPQGTTRLPDASAFYPALRDALGNTLLMQASRAGNVAMVAYLLDACPLTFAQALDIFGRNAAMIARDGGHADVLALLLQAGVKLQPDNPALQWYLQNRGDLAAAAAMQDWQPFASLLAQGNLMNLRDAQGRSLIFHAVMNADLDAVRFMCGCTTPPFLGWRDAYGLSVLRYTTRIPNVETGAAICQELRVLRRRTRWLHKRRAWDDDDEDRIAWTEPAWRKHRRRDA